MPNDVINPVSRSISVASTLSEGAREYVKRSARPNTRRAYATQIKQWIAWCERQRVADFPADPASVANYLSERAEAGQVSSTLRIVVAALKAGHDGKGLTFDSKAPVILRTLRGIGNSNPRLPKQAEPLRSTDVLGLMESTDATPLGLRDAALLALGYVFALRRSELVALDFGIQGDGAGVLRITAKTMEVSLAISKTSNGEAETVSVPRMENAEAIRAVEAWLKIADIRLGEPVMRRVLKGGKIGGRLHPQSVALIIKSRVGDHYQTLGADEANASSEGNRYSGHSLRVGFCVTAAEGGADLRAIASVSRHRSLTMPARYSQRAEQIKTSPHRLPGVGLQRRDKSSPL